MILLWKKMKKLLCSSDFFNSSNMLRFQKEDDYKTITGGVISIAIIAVIIVAFTKEILITLEKTSIQVTSNIVKNDIPTTSRLTFSPQTNGMFAILITGSSPNDNIRYFDVLANVYSYQSTQNGPIENYMTVNMVACTSAHFEGFQCVDSVYQLNGLYCPQLGTNFDIFGKLASGKQSVFNLYIAACNPSAPGAPCATQQQMTNFWMGSGGALPVSIFYLNTILTPDNPEYKRAYFEDRGYTYIGPSFGSDVVIEMAEYSINTDQSILPFTDEIIDSGLFIPSGLTVKSFPKSQAFSYYIFMRIMKSTDTYTYQRTVQKLSTIFSYIGGVISSLVTAFFIMNKYTSFAFEISMANQLFTIQEKSQNSNCQAEQAKKTELKEEVHEEQNLIPMSIFLYFKFTTYNFLKTTFKHGFKQQELDYLKQCQQQMTKQLDIKRIIKRINCLQHCISNIVEKQKLKNILYSQPATLQQIKRCRLEFEKQEKQIMLQEFQLKPSDIFLIKRGGQMPNHRLMQSNLSQQLSASGLSIAKYNNIQQELKRNNQQGLNQHLKSQKNRILGMTQTKSRVLKNEKSKIAQFLSQQHNLQQKQDDICEIPIDYCNFQKQ